MPRMYDIIDGPNAATLTYDEAKDRDENILLRIANFDATVELYVFLSHHIKQILAIIRSTLALSRTETCYAAERKDWLRGTFNISIPIFIDSPKPSRPGKLLMRIPMAHKIGGCKDSGNVDEKLLSEAATMISIHERASDVPIPKLYGFGLSTGVRFSHMDNASFIQRWYLAIHDGIVKWFSHSKRIPYISSNCPDAKTLGTGYLLLEFIDQARGQMLSLSWDTHRGQHERRETLFKGLSKIMLSLQRISFKAIGSLTINGSRQVVLKNRPFTLEIASLENEGVFTSIPRNRLYRSSEAYYLGLLGLHDLRLRRGTNVIYHAEDCRSQMSALATMRTILCHFLDQQSPQGPFCLALTDLHPSNLLVDEEWNITCVIDFEWTCSRPVDMIHPPFWISGHAVDNIDVDEYELVRSHFMRCLSEQERLSHALTPWQQPLTKIMERGWQNGTFWFSLATGLHAIFYNHIQPRYGMHPIDDEKFCEVASQYWTVDSARFIEQRVEDKRKYDQALRLKFEEDGAA